ncbi:hypothetical protein EW146_g936 [Bondarzewia mesenterica]|uniref:Succinate dehydrogenase assembly factor 4, mitochondrial n=1 Tax=Bondarzewia mesenterica TaxID=1095465 RepID=A0A4S4M7N3_9AGAM|nr:hypothetical protein EW146_g936 [Bondarzewia mesenterica]
MFASLTSHTFLRSLPRSQPPLHLRSLSSTIPRFYSDPLLIRPGPPPLPARQQREFEELVRKAQTQVEGSAEEDAHPDARAPLRAEFEGEVNPVTGERGGPKREPVGRWAEGEGDWSFKGRVSDF